MHRRWLYAGSVDWSTRTLAVVALLLAVELLRKPPEPALFEPHHSRDVLATLRAAGWVVPERFVSATIVLRYNDVARIEVDGILVKMAEPT